MRFASLIAGLFILLGLLPAIAQDDPPAEDPPPVEEQQAESAADDSERNQAPAEEAKPPAQLPMASIPLQLNLRFTVRPTILGLIPPDSAQDYGEGLIRVSGYSGNSVWLHYEIKEEIEKERGGEELFELHEAPLEMRTEYLTRIRRGDAYIEDIGQGSRIASPLFWGDGDIVAEGYGLLWMPATKLAQLKSSGSLDWDMQCVADPQSEMGSELAKLIDSRRSEAGLAEGEATRLEVIETEGRYIVPVNGAMSQLEAVHVRDNIGLAEYWFLDDADNPLLLKMSFIAKPDATPGQDGIARQVHAGIGFAITSLNY